MEVHAGDSVTATALRGGVVDGVVLDAWPVAGGAMCLFLKTAADKPRALVVTDVLSRRCPHLAQDITQVSQPRPGQAG